jgi:hypothetical protein
MDPLKNRPLDWDELVKRGIENVTPQDIWSARLLVQSRAADNYVRRNK